MINENDILLEELAEIEQMSVRSVNISRSLRLDSLNKLMQFYLKGGNFKSIRNCGQRTEDELIKICKKYSNGYSRPLPELLFLDTTIEKISSLPPFKKAALNKHVEYLLSVLNVRARNGIINLFGKRPTAYELIETIYSKGFDFYALRNIGEKSASELSQFKTRVSSYIEVLEAFDELQLTKEYTKLVIRTSFKNLQNFDDLFKDVFSLNNKIKLFTLINNLIQLELIFRKGEKIIFYQTYSTLDTNSIQEITNQLEIGKERVRQIKIILETKIKTYFHFILNFQPDDLPNYGIEPNTILLLIDNEFSAKINTDEGVNFNHLFYGSILSLLHSKTHSTLGDNETLTKKHKYSNSKRIRFCYLVKREIFNSFDFLAFTDSINEILDQRITEDYHLHFKGYLVQFSKENGKKYFQEISIICESILFNEFNLVVNTNGYLIFERNTRKQLIEYVIEALEEINELTKVEDIVKKINRKYPHLETLEQSVRATLQREKELFIYIGRSSTYGLRKWQEEKENLKGGTIRDLVEEYLCGEDEPRHISQIAAHVMIYRKTNEHNIRANLQLEDNVRFQFFPGEFVGLKSKEYKNLGKFKKAIGSHFRSAILRKMNGWDINDVISFYVKKFNYQPSQVKSLIERKVSRGDVLITPDNRLIS